MILKNFKKVFDFLLIVLITLSFVSCGENSYENSITTPSSATEQPIEVTEEESEQGGWRNEYADFLRNDEWPGIYGEYESPKFALVHLTDDDIPELVIGGGNFHAAGAHLYTYIGDEIVPVMSEDDNTINSYGDWGSLFYKERGGMVCKNRLSMGVETITIVKITQEGAKTVISLSNDEGARLPSEEATYKVNGKPVTYEEYSDIADNLDFSDYTYIYYDDMQDINKENIKLIEQAY